MSERSDAERFGQLFARVYDRYHARQEPGDYAPSREALGVLTHLLRTGPLTISEACRHFDRSQAAMSEIVSRLEERGLVARRPDERDRRRHFVWLTPEGRDLQARCTRVLATDRVADALDHLTTDERAALLEALTKLVDPPSRTTDDGDGT